MRSLVWCSMMILWGCSATNPAYDARRSSGTQSTSSSTASSGDVGENSSEGSCERPPPDPIEINVFNDSGRVQPNCSDGDGLMWLSNGSTIFEPNGTIIHEHCPPGNTACGCPGENYSIQFNGTVMVPGQLPDCGPIALWAAEGPGGGCEWAGLMLQADDSFIPEFIVSRTREIPPLALSLGLGGGGCGQSECDIDPGPHDLVVLDQSITVDGSPILVSVTFATGGMLLPYEIDNRMSSVDEDCIEHIAWTATRMPED